MDNHIYSEKIEKVIRKCIKSDGWATFYDIGNLFRKKRIMYKMFNKNNRADLSGYANLTQCIIINVKNVEIDKNLKRCKLTNIF